MSVHDGKVALVTGAASGIGYALCRELHARGATVYAADLNDVGLASLQQDCGNRLITTRIDVVDAASASAW